MCFKMSPCSNQNMTQTTIPSILLEPINNFTVSSNDVERLTFRIVKNNQNLESNKQTHKKPYKYHK